MDFLRSVLDAFILLWPIWAALGALALLRVRFNVARWVRLTQAGLNEVDRMTLDEFNECVTLIFEDLGHTVESVQRQEHGALLIVVIDGVRTAVLAEHSMKANVPSKAVEAAVTAQAARNCTDAMVVTNRDFTPKARQIASANDVVLCNRDELGLMLREWQENSAEREEETLDRAA